MLNTLADLYKQAEPLIYTEPIAVAVLGDGRTANVFHREVRVSAFCGSGIIDLGDIRMVQQGQGLFLRLESGDHLLGIHAGLDNLEGDLSLNRVFLPGQIDDPHSPFAQNAENLVSFNIRWVREID